MYKKIYALCCVALLASASVVAHADIIGTTETFTLTQDGCTGGCGPAPYGTIKLTQTATGVTVLETLLGGAKYVKTGAGDALEFNVAVGTIDAASITAGFGIGPAPDTASTFGSFLKSISCTGCGPGASSPLTGPLSFNVTGASVSGFTGNSGGFFFASDVLAGGNTGNVAALGSTPVIPSSTPEPSSLILLGTGIIGAAGVLRRKMPLTARS